MKKILIGLIFILSSASYAQNQNISISLNPPAAWQGKVIVVKVVSAEGISEIKAAFLGQKFNLYPEGKDFCGIVGVPVDQMPGKYPLNLLFKSRDGNPSSVTEHVRVRATNFPFSKFWLKPARDKLRAREIIEDEWAQIEKTLVVEDPVKCWQGRFSLPAQGRISQGFGHRQIINGKRAGEHRGMDIAITIGTSIEAANQGKIVFANYLRAFGGTIVLDHGQGIHTLYFHLSKFAARTGDRVNKGDIIAYSGNSGISSGPHLHWGMSVHNLRVDPKQWVNHEI